VLFLPVKHDIFIALSVTIDFNVLGVVDCHNLLPTIFEEITSRQHTATTYAVQIIDEISMNDFHIITVCMSRLFSQQLKAYK